MPPKKPVARRGAAKKAAANQEAESHEDDTRAVVEQAAAGATKSEPSEQAREQGERSITGSHQTDAAAVPSHAPPDAQPASASTPRSTPSVTRLDTLDRPASSASSRGRPATARPKFAGRRSVTARQELEKREAERDRAEKEARAAAVSREKRRQDGARRGAYKGRGRGGYMGEIDRRATSDTVPSGPFSLGQVSAQEKAKGNRRVPGGDRDGGGGRGDNFLRETGASSSTGVSSGGSRVKQENGRVDADGDFSMSGGPFIKAEDGGYISSDEDDQGKEVERRNVDDLRVIDLTGDDDDVQLSRIFAPVRLKREEHKVRTLGMSGEGTEGAAVQADEDDKAPQVSERRKGKQRAKDVEITGEQRGFMSAWGDALSGSDPEPRIKTEPIEDERPSTPEPVPTAQMLPQSPPTSPEAKRKAKDKIKARSSSSKLEPPDYQLREEKVEWERHQNDLKILRGELGKPAPVRSADAVMDGAGDEEDPRQGKVYLFQFPPVLPDLEPVTVKPDPDTADGTGDAMDLDKPANSASNPVIVDDVEALVKARQPKLPSGAVGKLRIHASGRATLDWGGTSLELGMGTEASFLQDVLVADLTRGEKGDYQGGTAMSMGQVKGKFVVTPNWEEILR